MSGRVRLTLVQVTPIESDEAREDESLALLLEPAHSRQLRADSHAEARRHRTASTLRVQEAVYAVHATVPQEQRRRGVKGMLGANRD